MGIHEKLLKIQTELKAPKNLHNKFGNYNYRSCESILEAVKPLCLEQNCTLLICDDIILTGSENYIKAIAVLTDIESGERIEATAFAREATDKKGMDSSQITGSSSSYARKYALNGLFLIDDTKDADDMDNGEQKKDEKPSQNQTPPKANTPKQFQTPLNADPAPIDELKLGELMSLITQKGSDVKKITNFYKRTALSALTNTEYEDCKSSLLKKPDKVTSNE